MNKVARWTNKHHTLVFFGLCVLFVGVGMIFRFHPLLQAQILTALTLLYIGTSLVHHHLDKTLNLEVMLEYVLISTLAVIILFGLIA